MGQGQTDAHTRSLGSAGHGEGIVECVANVSEGQSADVLATLAGACGPALLDIHTDGDHHRSVFTLAAYGGTAAVDAALALTRAVAGAVDISAHDGVHPRLGAIDVVPFIALDGAFQADAVACARSFGAAVAGELGLPAFLYDAADPDGRTLPSVRRDAFKARQPDFGPQEPHPRMGAVCVGARNLMIAVNWELATDDLGVASAVAKAVRERDGGLPGVRALGFPLPSVGRAQVSMNLVDLTATGLEAASDAVNAEVRRLGSEVVALELVGLIPAAELARCSPEFLSWSGLGPDHTIEARLRTATG
ncbi:MAG: glutamate formimidoyltransferase [Acidimicrobiia bacterium]